MSDANAELKQQRRNFDLLLRAQRFGRTGYIISDIPADRVYWSDSLFEQRKIPRRPYFTIAEGRTVIHPDDLPAFVHKREQAIRDGKEFEHEMRIICGDGSILWERGRSQPQFDPQGTFVGLLSVVDDVTEERNAAASLMEQEATYRALFNSIGDAIFLSANGAFVDCNDAALKTFGATREQLIAHSPVEFSPPFQPDGRPSLKVAQEKIAAALAGQRQVFEWRHCRVDGTEFDAEVVLSRVEGGADSSYFFGVVRDITGRKQAEKALKASHDKFAGAFTSSTDAMIVMRMGERAGEGIFLDANPAAAELFGLAWGEMIGKTARQINLLTSEQTLAAFRKEILAREHVHAFRARTRHTDGTTRDVEISASLFGPPDDRLAILVVRDVTEQQAATRKIGELNSSLESSVRQLRAIADNLPVGISQTSMDGDILFLNRTLETWLGTSAEKARGRPFIELFSKEYLEATKPMREAFAAGAATVEQTIPLPDGTTRTVAATNIRDVDAAGVQHGNFGLIVDITSQKHAEAELKKTVGQLQAIANNLPVAISYHDAERRFLFLNRTMEQWFNVTSDEIIGKTVDGLVTEEYHRVLRPIRDRFAHGEYRYEATLPYPDGQTRTVDVSFVPDLNNPENKGGFYTLAIDITARRRDEAEIKTSHEKFASAFEYSTDAMWVSEVGNDLLHDVTIDLNHSAELMLDVKRAEVIGSSLPEPVNPLTTGQLVQYRDLVLKHGSARDFPVSFTIADAPIETLLSGSVFTVGDKRMMMTVLRDVTAAKRAEDELRSSHEKFASAFEYSTDAMWVSTVADDVWGATIVDINRSAARMLGIRREDVLGKPVGFLRQEAGGSPNNSGNLAEYRRLMERDGHVRELPIELRRQNGEVFPAVMSGSRFLLGGKLHTLTLMRDVSEAREAEKKIHDLNLSLEANLRLLRAVADNLPVAIGYQDAENRFRFVNRTLEQWFGATEAEMLGRTVPEFVSPAYMTAVQAVRRALDEGRTTVEVTLPFPDGKTRTVDSTMIIDRDENGAPRGRYSLLIDVTERKAAEEQMLQSQKMQAIGKLTGGVAHDFNNLLAVIAGNLDLASERNQDEKIARFLEPARRAAERGSTLTKSLLAFSRQQPLSPQVADLNMLARDMTELLRRTLPSNIGIEFVGGAGLWKSEVDPGQLQNALLNLVVNARDAMPDGGRLTIETQNARIDAEYGAAHDLPAGQYVMLAVSDTGTGMPAEVIARAFEPFYTTKGVGQGTGLGLSMVYGFAKQSGGHVAIYSEVGSGTTVKIYLPRWKGAEAEASAAARTVPSAANETVLVVEDDADMRLIAVTMLRSLGYTVIEAPDGGRALKALAENSNVALLVTDVVLAGAMNGRRLAEEARQANPQLKVLFMSGYTEDAIMHHGRLEPGVNFIQKPFRKQDLAIKAREALDGKPH